MYKEHGILLLIKCKQLLKVYSNVNKWTTVSFRKAWKQSTSLNNTVRACAISESEGSQLTTTWSQPDLSESFTKGPNNAIRLEDHERSCTNNETLLYKYRTPDKRKSPCHSCSCIVDTSDLRQWINANMNIQWKGNQTRRDELNIWYFTLQASITTGCTYIHTPKSVMAPHA
jgi:hypothetical protein